VFGLWTCGIAAGADQRVFYIGGAIGQGQVAANVQNPFAANAPSVVPESDKFKESHSAFKVLIGLRPVSWFGAELSYVDFGDPNGTLFGHPANASMKGTSALAVLYLPVHFIEVFGKAGLARIQGDVSGYAPNGSLNNICEVGVPCGAPPFRQDQTSTTFAAGAGVQYGFGSWAVRGEYERFNFAGENPYLLSLGLTWTF